MSKFWRKLFGLKDPVTTEDIKSNWLRLSEDDFNEWYNTIWGDQFSDRIEAALHHPKSIIAQLEDSIIATYTKLTNLERALKYADVSFEPEAIRTHKKELKLKVSELASWQKVKPERGQSGEL